MANPWGKKNPMLSMMLSGANAWAGAARGIWTAAARRQQRVVAKKGTKQVADLWTAALTPPMPPRKKARRRTSK